MPDCECRCGGETKSGDFLPGHDQKLRAEIERQMGGLLKLRALVEAAKDMRIECSGTFEL